YLHDDIESEPPEREPGYKPAGKDRFDRDQRRIRKHDQRAQTERYDGRKREQGPPRARSGREMWPDILECIRCAVAKRVAGVPANEAIEPRRRGETKLHARMFS